jgi:cytochrome oxidase assembly protein ShyY1
VYRFLLTPRWLAAAAVAVAAAVVMVFLGNWQLDRYRERSAINDRIDAAESAAPVPLTSVLAAPTAPGTAGPSPGRDKAWTKVTMTGRYDPAHEIQARGRTVDRAVGFEIVTPLVLADGTAVLVDRGWIPPARGGAVAAPSVPPAPSGTVTVVGRVHLSESRPAPLERRDGRIDTRRISLPQLAKEMPYPVYGGYVLLDEQTPAADPTFVAIPVPKEDAWQNGGYAVQWWLFAVMALVAFGWQARREAHGDGPRPAARDRVEEADRAGARSRLPEDEPTSARSASGAGAAAPGPGAGVTASGPGAGAAAPGPGAGVTASGPGAGAAASGSGAGAAASGSGAGAAASGSGAGSGAGAAPAAGVGGQG